MTQAGAGWCGGLRMINVDLPVATSIVAGGTQTVITRFPESLTGYLPAGLIIHREQHVRLGPAVLCGSTPGGECALYRVVSPQS